MRLLITNQFIKCPRIEKNTAVSYCKKCYFLGWVENRKVICRWSQEKEDLIKGNRYYEINTI